ncbi:MAG: hypothetical protein IPN07_00730 [Dehalococcoidia bacterium]|nr:hypothetical protein [Dehalococcoidia bacterium]
MRILRLGSSIDSEGETPPEDRAASLAGRILASASGEQVETILRMPRPNERMPEIVEGWVAELKPEIVCFNISSHWCEAELIALRLQRLGPAGRFLSRRLNSATRSYDFNASPLVRLSRSVATRVVGGRPPFTPAEAATAIEASLRRVVRHEHVAVVVAGSPYSAALEGGAAARRRAMRRRAELFGRLAPVCDSLHIPYDLPPHDADAFAKAVRTRDRLHFGPEMHRRCGELQGRLMVAAWQAAQVETRMPSGQAGRPTSSPACRGE